MRVVTVVLLAGALCIGALLPTCPAACAGSISTVDTTERSSERDVQIKPYAGLFVPLGGLDGASVGPVLGLQIVKPGSGQSDLLAGLDGAVYDYDDPVFHSTTVWVGNLYAGVRHFTSEERRFYLLGTLGLSTVHVEVGSVTDSVNLTLGLGLGYQTDGSLSVEARGDLTGRKGSAGLVLSVGYAF
jgi:hypothetical protein